jgi:FAD/FMN-containing dehydrogenase
LGAVSQLSRTVRVGAGCITENVHKHCEAANLTWPIDLASKGSCQIGGNLSTNAGGLRVIRHGMARKWVTSLQVVTMEGSILELNAELEKNNTGYDLLQLIVGSEGTLGVITEATLKLAPISRDVNRAVFFFALKGIEGLPYLFEKARQGPFDILAFEFFSQRCLQAVGEKLKRSSRLGHSGAFYVVMEVAGPESRDAWLDDVLGGENVVDALQAESSEDRRAVWGLREGITESIAMTGRARKHDLSVPIVSVAPFLADLEKALQKDKYSLELFLFGHFGDGSPHVNLVNPPGASFAAFNRDCDRFEEILFPLLQKYRGSISSEHGIGLLKKKWLRFSRTAEEIRIFRGIKAALDPKALLNPGKILDF